MKNIIRHQYLEVLSAMREQNLIKVVTGIRRAGKSTIMLQFQDLLREEAPDIPIVSINLDVPEFRFLAERSWSDIYDFIKLSLKPDCMNYVFLDEIQNVKEFEKLLEGLYVHPNVDLYVTGSNAYLLSSELATLLTGRAFEINVLPFSFAEYMECLDSQPAIEKAFAAYIQTGGIPEAIRLASANVVYAYQYLQMLYKTIFENDICRRSKINSETIYHEIVKFLIDSVGSPVSPTNIANTLTSAGKRVDKATVSRYIQTMTEAYIFYKSERYDIKGKQYLSSQEKYYVVDLGFRYALLGKELAVDTGHLLENIVYTELLRRGNQLWTGKVGNAEVDFVARDKKGYTKYIQVSQTVKNQDTLTRELAPFDKIDDHYERILITMDYETGSRNGVKQINLIEWLMEKQ